MAFSSVTWFACHGKVTRKVPKSSHIVAGPIWLCHAVFQGSSGRDSPVIKELTNTRHPSISGAVSRCKPWFSLRGVLSLADATSRMEANQVASLTKSRYS